MRSRIVIIMIWTVMIAGSAIGQDSLHITRLGYCNTPGRALGVTVAGNYAYVADYDHGLRIIDVANSAVPIQTGFVDTPGGSYTVEVAGNRAYVADQAGGLRIIDIANPYTPFELGFYDTPGAASGVAVEGDYAYVGDRHGGFRVVNVTNPAAPVEVGFYDAPGWETRVAIDGSIAYVGNWSNGLRIINVASPASPFEVGFCETPGSAWGVVKSLSHVYIGDRESGLRIIDVTNPSAPAEAGFYDTADSTYGLAVVGTIVFISDWNDGLRVIDATDPAAPTEIGYYDTPGHAHDVAVAGNTAYVADDETGLGIYDVSFFAQRVRIVSPNGGETLQLFSSQTIEWLRLDTTGTFVRIELNRNFPTGEWEILADSTENDGHWEWFVTEPLSTTCRIRISIIGESKADVSDGDFTIATAHGYLALVRPLLPAEAVLNWSAGEMECGEATEEVFKFKNFGESSIVVFEPVEPASAEFARATNCGNSFVLIPEQISDCDVTLSFNPTMDGIIEDTLLIQTDAINGINGFVRIPLRGEQIRTPAAPEVVIQQTGQSVRLSWNPVDVSRGGCPITATHYLVFYAPTSDGEYYYHGGTTDTTYLHQWVIQYAEGMFYNVFALTNPPPLVVELPGDGELTRSEVMKWLEVK